MSFPKSPQVKPSVLTFVVAPPPPPAYWHKHGELTTADPTYVKRTNAHFKRYPVKLQADKEYTIDLKGAFDTYLFLEDANQKILRHDDDSGDGLDSRIIYRATKTAMYHIVATSYGGGRTGTFHVVVRERE